MSDKTKSILRYCIISVLVIIGISLICIEPIQNYMIKSYHPKINQQTVQASIKNVKAPDVNYDFSQVKSVSATQVAEARWKANQNHYVGQIVAPEIGVHLPIGLGVGNDVLMLGAGTMRADMQMGKGNYALAGHHMKDNSVLFSPFYVKAKVGMMVYITDMNKLYAYRITERKIVPPTAVNVIDNTKSPVLTLITCNDSGSQRLYTRATLVKTTKLSGGPLNVLHMLGATSNNHNVLKGY